MANLEQAWKKAGPGMAVDIQNLLKSVAPVDKGRLKISIKARFINNEIVISMVFYGAHQEFGTPPHEIKIKNKKVLANKKKKQIFGKRVMHPGSPPRPWFRPAFKKELGRIFMRHITKHLGD